MAPKKEYKIALDVLRILAILAVVLIHTTSRTLEATKFALIDTQFTLLLNQIARFAVPMFFIISGFVLELNYHLNENFITYMKKRLDRLILPYIFWSVIYYFIVYVTGRNPNFLYALLRGDASYQLYFIPTLFIFYLVFPFIHRFLGFIGNKWVMITLFLAQCGLLYFDYNVHPLKLPYPVAVALLNSFAFTLGVVAAKNYDEIISFIKKWKLVLGVGAAALGYYVFHEGLSNYLRTNNYQMFYSQWRPSVMTYSIFLAAILYWVFDRNIFNNSITKTLSKLSFFVFFIHIIILEVLWKFVGVKIFQIQFAQSGWWDPVYFLSVTVISFLIAYVVHKIPNLNKLTG